MPRDAETSYEAASAVSIGKRPCQEDAVLFDCPLGGETGLVVLSDGMGGHASGDVASKIVLTEVFSELKLQSIPRGGDGQDHRAILIRAAEGADDCIRAYVEDRPDSFGMGATLVAAILSGAELHWISIGDSPLYLYRGGVLTRLNAEHSFGQQIEAMVASGLMAREVADRHPDRNCLTSVVGGGGIAEIDCPGAAFRMQDGDLLVFASDGLEYLTPETIRGTLGDMQGQPCARIAGQLLREIEALDDPDQDNVSIVVVRVRLAEAPALRQGRPRSNGVHVVPARPGGLVALRAAASGAPAAARRRQPCDTP